MPTTPEAALFNLAERAVTFAADQDVPPFETPHLHGTPMRAREQLVRWHGSDDDGFGTWVYPGRTVIEVPGRTWPVARPENCTDESFTGIWFDATGNPVPDVLDPDAPESVVLLCAQCGLDCTIHQSVVAGGALHPHRTWP
jgi:hypothetical protein